MVWGGGWGIWFGARVPLLEGRVNGLNLPLQVLTSTFLTKGFLGSFTKGKKPFGIWGFLNWETWAQGKNLFPPL